MITNPESGTCIDEIADGIYRISTPVPPTEMPGGFTFNQYLIDDDDALLYHTGPKKLFPLVTAAIATILPAPRLRYICFSHYEADECGALNDFLGIAPAAEPLCGTVAKMVSIDDVAIRPARALADRETLSLGAHTVQWFDTPHVPHGWECGHLFEETTRTLFCGDLFTQGGAEHPAWTTDAIVDSSEMMRAGMDYFAHAPNTAEAIEWLAETNPRTLACMHGAAYRGDGAAQLRALSQCLTRQSR